MVLAEDGDVRDDVRGGDVAGNDDDAREGGVGGGGCGRFAEGFDDFFDAALEGVVLGSCGQMLVAVSRKYMGEALSIARWQ